MFKPFIPCQDYSFDINGACEKDNKIFNAVNDLVRFEKNGQIFCFNTKWLGLISHYEVNLSFSEILKIDFVPCESKIINSRCGFLMMFKKPIKDIVNGFFIIPGYTNFSINCIGNVRSRKTGRILKHAINAYGYPYVNIYDADKSRWRSVCVHILIARTFVSSSDPSNLFFVNHKNGIKTDFRPLNLEWVSSNQNNSHAVENNLRSDNRPCKVRDIKDLSELCFKSVSQCLKHIGFKRASYTIDRKNNGVTIPKLLLGRYEIKYLDDNSDWFYTKEKATNRYLNVGPYEAKNVLTGEIFEGSSIKILSNKIKISKDRVSDALRSAEPKIYDDFLIRQQSPEQWPCVFTKSIFTKPRCFRLLNLETGDIKFFNSLRQTVSFLGIDKRTFKLRLTRNQFYNEWEINEIAL